MNTERQGDGGCQCGTIRYRLDGPPEMLYICHCTDCRKQSASAFGMSLIMLADKVEIVAGRERLRSLDVAGSNGAIKRCYYCADCGTRILHGSEDPSESVSIKAGSLDEIGTLEPDAHIWVRSALPWVQIDRDRYACFEQQPDAAGLAAMRQRRRQNDA